MGNAMQQQLLQGYSTVAEQHRNASHFSAQQFWGTSTPGSIKAVRLLNPSLFTGRSPTWDYQVFEAESRKLFDKRQSPLESRHVVAA